MENPGLPASLWKVLDGGLWHATSPEGLNGIVMCSEIRIMQERYNNSFCKFLGAISLFDFGPTAVDDWDQFKNWSGWFGFQQKSRVAVWISIEREYVSCNLIDAVTTHKKWKNKPSARIIPGVEACHIGAIPLAAITGVVLIDRYSLPIFTVQNDVDRISEKIVEFERSLPMPPPTSHFSITQARY